MASGDQYIPPSKWRGHHYIGGCGLYLRTSNWWEACHGSHLQWNREPNFNMWQVAWFCSWHHKWLFRDTNKVFLDSQDIQDSSEESNRRSWGQAHPSIPVLSCWNSNIFKYVRVKGERIHLEFIQKFWKICMGPACLANFYRMLGKASKGSKTITGPLSLLQVIVCMQVVSHPSVIIKIVIMFSPHVKCFQSHTDLGIFSNDSWSTDQKGLGRYWICLPIIQNVENKAWRSLSS